MVLLCSRSETPRGLAGGCPVPYLKCPSAPAFATLSPPPPSTLHTTALVPVSVRNCLPSLRSSIIVDLVRESVATALDHQARRSSVFRPRTQPPSTARGPGPRRASGGSRPTKKRTSLLLPRPTTRLSAHLHPIPNQPNTIIPRHAYVYAYASTLLCMSSQLTLATTSIRGRLTWAA